VARAECILHILDPLTATATCDMGCPCAGSQREVDAIVTDYLGGGKQVGQ
jgi:hypothetical protein